MNSDFWLHGVDGEFGRGKTKSNNQRPTIFQQLNNLKREHKLLKQRIEDLHAETPKNLVRLWKLAQTFLSLQENKDVILDIIRKIIYESFLRIIYWFCILFFIINLPELICLLYSLIHA